MQNRRTVAYIRLHGGFSVNLDGGEKIVIPSRKGRAVLAILATSPGFERSRTWLQQCLWSRGSSQDSLRKEISILRTLFKEHHIPIFNTEVARDTVALNPSSFQILEVEFGKDQPNTFLEGLEFPHEPNFVEWLNSQRENADTDNSHGLAAPISGKPSSTLRSLATRDLSQVVNQTKSVKIGIQQLDAVLSENSTFSSNAIASDFLDRITSLLHYHGGVEIYDGRYGNNKPDLVGSSLSSQPDYWVFTRLICSYSHLVLTCQLRDSSREKVISNRRIEIPLNSDGVPNFPIEKMQILIAEIVDEIIFNIDDHISRESSEVNSVIQIVNRAILGMFDLSYQGLDEAKLSLDDLTNTVDLGIAHAWRAFLTTQQVDDSRITDFSTVQKEARFHAEQAIRFDRHNPVVHSLLTHVNAFTLKDFDSASYHIASAKNIGSDHLMTYDADALFNLYTGNLQDSRASALKAAELGRLLPFRYLFLTSLCMIDGLSGKFESAIQSGERALAVHPKSADRPYPPTIRYLASSYSNLGKGEKAETLLRILKTEDKKALARDLASNELAAPSFEIANYLKIGESTLSN